MTLRKDLQYLQYTYGDSPVLYRMSDGRMLVFAYDSYSVAPTEWARALKPGHLSIRGTDSDAFVVGLVVDHAHLDHIVKSGFDGFYTYFATNGFSYGSTWNHWRELGEWADQHEKLFVPCVGPGMY